MNANVNVNVNVNAILAMLINPYGTDASSSLMNAYKELLKSLGVMRNFLELILEL